jgi:endonuclease-3
MDESNRLLKIIKILDRKYKVKIPHRSPFRTLIGCVLSQRTKDETTWPATERLFKAANTPRKMLKLRKDKIAKLIYPVGFYNQKAERIKQISKMVLEEYNGKVPKTREQLMQLPGVGPKCADIILSYGYGIPSIAIDTHCNRIPKRLGMVNEDANLEDVKNVLESLVPKNKWNLVNHLLVTFGKDICQPRVPKCYLCPVEKLCKYPNKNLK